MKKVWLFTVIMVLGFTCMALAAEGEGKSAVQFFLYSAELAAGLAIGLAASGCGVGMGLAVKGALEGMARNPETSGKLTVTMLIGLAMIESLTIYALVISLILMYANPIYTRIAPFLGMPK